MISGSTARHMRQAGTLAVAAAMLLSAVPAFGENVSTTTTPTPAPVTPVTPVTPVKPSAPAPAAKTTTNRAPADTNSAIQTPVTQQTEAFRAALAEKQKRVDEFNAQLDALDRELEIASQEYNGAADRLAEMQNEVQVAQTDLENARQAYDLQSSILSQRAASNYRDGDMGTLRGAARLQVDVRLRGSREVPQHHRPRGCRRGRPRSRPRRTAWSSRSPTCRTPRSRRRRSSSR